MPETIVRCHKLRKSSGGVGIVDNVSFTLPTGQILALLGPSRSGKTTVLRLIAGLESLDTGWIEVAGKTVATERVHVPPEKRRVGLLAAENSILPQLTVSENVAAALQRHHEVHARTAELLAVLDLAELENQMPPALTSAQRQRLALARALAPEPALLLLDDPFAAMDDSLRIRLRADVRELLKGTSVIFATNSQAEALFVGQRVAVLNAGRIEQIDTQQGLISHPRTRFVAEFIRPPASFPGHANLAEGNDV